MLTIQLKQLGKKKIKKVNYDLGKTPENLKELLELCVQAEVQKYNESREEDTVYSFLSPKQIQEQSASGKVGFGELENKTLAIEQEAVENALLGFKDGLFLVFINDVEVKDLQQKLDVTTDSTITFIRMTFLVGTYW